MQRDHRLEDLSTVSARGLEGAARGWTSATIGAIHFVSPLQRAWIIALAFLDPVARELHITHWFREYLALQAVADGIVPAIRARIVDNR